MDTHDYLNFARYKNQPASSVAGFSAFQDAVSGLYYFCMLDDDGSVVLISEGYPTEAARDNGINSVINNRDIDERYHLTVTGNGFYYLSLKSANHQEIARTDTFGSESLANKMLPSARKKAKAVVETLVSPASEVVAEAERKFNWWWLLLLLLLIPLFLIWRNSQKKPEVVIPPIVKPTDTMKTESVKVAPTQKKSDSMKTESVKVAPAKKLSDTMKK